MKRVSILGNMNNRIVIIILACICQCVSHAADDELRERYANVLEHYRGDSIKYKAATFLIDNMSVHKSPSGLGIASYICNLRKYPPRTNIGKLSREWKVCNPTGYETFLVYDSILVTDEYLIRNIDDAIETWQASPWKEDISFDVFCRYILPYKVSDEYITSDWRKALRTRYSQCIENVTDLKEAFVILRKEVLGRIRNSISYTPFCVDVLSYEYMQRANCHQRCILLASVLRAFGIPSAVDAVPVWADYSTMGHSWVSLVKNDEETYTVYEDESEARVYNKIDASLFIKDENALTDLGKYIDIKTEKGVSKIYRNEYGIVENSFGNYGKFNNPCIKDVSGNYGLDGTLTVFAESNTDVYLCTFVSGKDWTPIAYKRASEGKAVFEHLGKGIVYLPVTFSGKKKISLSSPVLLEKDNRPHFFDDSENGKSEITLYRKYPLCSYIPIQWMKHIGGIFEASDDSLFSNSDTLHVIKNVPTGNTEIMLDSDCHYRYIRYNSPKKEIALLSELAFYGQTNNGIKKNEGKIIQGLTDPNTANNIKDGDIETKIKAKAPGYWIGMDLGNNTSSISKITFRPVSDGNDIQKGHQYELYGFMKSWTLLGSTCAEDNGCLKFNNVPQGIILLLKDRTKGKEERIFEYKENRQIWY